MKDKESEERERRELYELLDILAARADEEHRPTERDLDRIDEMIRSRADGYSLSDPSSWGINTSNAILDPVDRILDALGERRIREHLDPAHPMSEGRSLWMACRIWSRWTQIADLVETIEGTTLCESDKVRFLLRLRPAELTDGTERGFRPDRRPLSDPRGGGAAGLENRGRHVHRRPDDAEGLVHDRSHDERRRPGASQSSP